MTIEEAREIIAKAQPIVLPTSGNTTTIKGARKITTFKDLFNGNSRRKKREDGNGTEETET